MPLRCDFFEMNARERCSDLQLGLYENTFDAEKEFKRNQSAARTASDTSTDTHSYASVQHRQHRPVFAQYIKKRSPSTSGHLQNIYVNIPVTPPAAKPLLRFSPIQQALNKINVDQIYVNLNASPVYINLKAQPKVLTIEPTPVEKTSSAKDTTQTVEHVEVNMVPNCRDKSDLYRTKMPLCIPSILPILTNTHQRRPSHTTRRHRPRTAMGFRGTTRSSSHSNGMRQRRPRTKVRYPTAPTDRWRRASQRNRPRKSKTVQSISNQTYNEIDSEEEEEEEQDDRSVCAIPTHGIPADQNAVEDVWNSRAQVFSTSENIEANPKDETSAEEDDDEDLLFSHNTFEDFLFRRRPQSSYSSTASECSTPLSDEVPSPPPHRAKTPLPPVSIRRCPGGMTLGLARSDVDFIHTLIRRSPNNASHASNRITALKEAYLRAANKQVLLSKACQTNRRNDKEAFLRGKIRNELERYDELPLDLHSCFDDDDERLNDHHLPSTVHRVFNFISSVKRRAQSNIRQMKRNFRTLRSRLFIEHMAIPPYQYGYRHRHYNPPARVSRERASMHRTASHQSTRSIDNTNALHHRQVHRTHPDASQQHQFANHRAPTERRHRRQQGNSPKISRSRRLPTFD